jgi:hypothetical protein
VVYTNTINYVIAKDNEDFSEVVAISPFPGVFGNVEVHYISYNGPVEKPIQTITIPLNLPLRIGKSTITINRLLVTDIYVSSSDSTGKEIYFYNAPQTQIYEQEASLIFYGQGELHGTFFFEGTIYIVIRPSVYPTDIFINMFGLYYIGHELLIYK